MPQKQRAFSYTLTLHQMNGIKKGEEILRLLPIPIFITSQFHPMME
jgi:hypothetical protein